MSIIIRVWGDYACFTRPEFKTERVSYDIITPSAARGVLDSIYWKPEFTWVIDRIHVMKPPRFMPFARNEVQHGIRISRAGQPTAPYYYAKENRACRSSQILRDVEYYIEARLECNPERPSLPGNPNTPDKHYEIFNRRASTGGFFRVPYLGCSEYRADFELVDHIPPSPLLGTSDLGLMLHDFMYRGPAGRPEPRFFQAVMVNGVVSVPVLQP